ncbi:MAG: carbohydrate-binding domain-containing protein [Lachnospiraceae bacterium]|nr:carbohydrate-binding domain-containing protein [Lachnospiraceae bacterium]
MFNKKAKYTAMILTAMFSASVTLTGCGASGTTAEQTVETQETETVSEASEEVQNNETEQNTDDTGAAASESQSADDTQGVEEGAETAAAETTVTTVAANTDGVLDTTDLFSERDLTQTADLSEAVTYTVSSNEDIHITEAGVYVIQGTASEATVYVEAEDTDKVQLVLNGVSITNTDTPCIYVVSADKVFVTTSSDSSLTVTGTFAEDEENADAAIFSCEDLVLNGTAALTIQSGDVGVDTKDDLKVTGGTYTITAGTKAFEANDSIRIADGTFTLNAGTDGLHAENNDDDSLGYVYIAGGTFTITAGDDGIHGVSVVQIDGGAFTISAAEGIEGTYIQLNGGTFDISASDDGINAASKSSSYAVTLELTGGDYTIVMGSGDTDALDSNGNLIISGGTLDITATSAFDYDGTGTYTGGTLIVNGETVTSLTQSMMGGGMQGGMGGMNRGMGGTGGMGSMQPGGSM